MKHLVSYQREVDKGKLTAVASFEKLTFQREPFVRSKYCAPKKDSRLLS